MNHNILKLYWHICVWNSWFVFPRKRWNASLLELLSVFVTAECNTEALIWLSFCTALFPLKLIFLFIFIPPNIFAVFPWHACHSWHSMLCYCQSSRNHWAVETKILWLNVQSVIPATHSRRLHSLLNIMFYITALNFSLFFYDITKLYAKQFSMFVF